MLRTNPPQSEPNIWMQIEKRIAELLDGGPAPTDPEDQRLQVCRGAEKLGMAGARGH